MTISRLEIKSHTSVELRKHIIAFDDRTIMLLSDVPRFDIFFKYGSVIYDQLPKLSRNEVENLKMSFGLTNREAEAIVLICHELLTNARFGFSQKVDIGDTDVVSGFAAYKRLGLDSTVRLEVSFDTETGHGDIIVEHPIHPQISTPLSQERIESRPNRPEPGRRVGGIYSINDGAVRQNIIDFAHLDHSGVKISDDLNKNKRVISLHFWRESWPKILELRKQRKPLKYL